MMTCDFCGLDIDVVESRDGCAACSVWGGGGCKYVKCPRCGYEMPELPSLPAWAKRLKSFLQSSPPASGDTP